MNLVVKQTWTRNLVGAAVLAALAACGGGGGGSANNNTGGGTEQTASVTGVAAKGLMKFAKVVVKDAVSGAVLKETTTDETGNYTVTGLPIGTAVLIEVSAVAGTKIVDEATNTEIDAPANFTLRAATVADAAGTANVQVTPFSEMAVAKAITAGGLSKDNIAAANADVRAFVGFDVLSVKPEFAIDSDNSQPTKPKNAAALLLASVSQLAKDDASTLDGTCTGSTQADKIKCVVEKMASKGTDDSTVVTLLTKGRDAAEANYVGTEDKPRIVAQPEELTPVTQYASAIEAAKALISSLRNNINRISASGSNEPEGGSLQTRVTNIATAFEQTADPFGPSSREVYGVALTVANMLDEGAIPGNTFTLNPGPTQAAINCTATSSVEEGPFDAATCRIVYGYPRPTVDGRYVHVVDVSRVDFSGAVPPGKSVGQYRVNSKLVSSESGMDTPVTPAADATSPVYEANIQLTRDNDPSRFPYSIVIAGRFVTGLSQALSEQAYYNDVSFNITPSIQEFDADGDEINETQSIALNLTGNFSSGGSSAATAKGEGLLAINNAYIRSGFDNSKPGSLQVAETLREFRSASLNIVGTTPAGVNVNGSLSIENFASSASGEYLPGSVVFSGDIDPQKGVGSLFRGEIRLLSSGFDNYNSSVTYSASNRITNASVRLDGSLRVPGGLPIKLDLTVNEVLDESRLAYTFSGFYSQGVGPDEDEGTPAQPGYIKVLVSGASRVGDTAAYVTFTEASSGVLFRLDEGEDFGVLKKAGITVANFSRRSSKIQYSDGSFEQY